MSAIDFYECYCDCGEPATVYSERTVKKAKKVHQCCECSSSILPGESYKSIFGIWDNMMDHFKVCQRCLELKDWAKISVPCFCYCNGELHNAVEDMVDQVRHHVPGFYFEYGRRMVRIRQHQRAHPYVHTDQQRLAPQQQN